MNAHHTLIYFSLKIVDVYGNIWTYPLYWSTTVENAGILHTLLLWKQITAPIFRPCNPLQVHPILPLHPIRAPRRYQVKIRSQVPQEPALRTPFIGGRTNTQPVLSSGRIAQDLPARASRVRCDRLVDIAGNNENGRKHEDVGTSWCSKANV